MSLPSSRAGAQSDPGKQGRPHGRSDLAKAATMTPPSVRVDLRFHLQSGCANARSAFEIRSSSSPTDCPHRQRIFPSQLNFFCFMADHKAFAFTERVFHLFQTDFDFQPLAAICHRKPKCSAFLRGATWPE